MHHRAGPKSFAATAVRLALALVVGIAVHLGFAVTELREARAGGSGSCNGGTCNGSDTCENCPSDCGACVPVCGNATCEAGESCATCAGDCGACPAVCGNATCESGESCSTCAADCGACAPVCGDAVCNGTETCSDCPGDCGACPTVCGNATCEAGETCSTCAADCGACTGVCGDSTCNAVEGETCTTCPGDCGTCPVVCGDGTCSASEDCSSCAADCGSCSVVCGDGTCDSSETCTTCSADCGTCASAGDFASCPYDLPACTVDANDCCYRSFGAGTIVIPMDRCHQEPGTSKLSAPTADDAFCEDPAGGGDDGMFHAYGLVYRLMQNDIPVSWIVNPTKDPPALTNNTNLNSQVYNDRDIDVWILSSGASAAEVGDALTACGAGCTPPVLHLDDDLASEPGSYTFQQFPMRGAVFAIAPEDRTAFDALWATWRASGNTLLDFTAIEMYEIQAGAEMVYLDYRGAGPTYAEFNSGNSGPVAITIDYDPPRLARESPAGVSDLWLAKAKLNEPSNTSCKSGSAFSPASAVYCDLTNDDMEQGYLLSGDFDWAWIDRWNAQGGTCDSADAKAMMDELIEFMTAIPGTKDGGSILFMEGGVDIAEQCTGKEPLGASGGLDTNSGPTTEPYIIRYAANVISQFGDVPANFAQGSPTNWNRSTAGYQDLDTLVRLVSEDTGTLCSLHKSTSACDTYTATTGDGPDFAVYARYQDVAANGIAFYMGGNQITQNGNAAHLRMVLNAFLAIPHGFVDSTPPESTLVVEVSRNQPIVAVVGGDELQFQGTVAVIDPPVQITTFANNGTGFRFPHYLGHMRALDVSALGATATDFDDLTTVFDAANGIPTPNAAGCPTNFDSSCRTVFTSLATGADPAITFVSTANRDALRPFILSSAASDADTDLLISMILAGRDEDGDGTLEPQLGGVDRSTVAVIEPSPVVDDTRPTMIYFGGLDGMLHAVCAEATGPCNAAGRELWAYIPRTQLPLLQFNTQRIDGPPKVSDVFADFDGDGDREFKTVLVFQTGSGAPGTFAQAPATIALDISNPADPKVLWEIATPAVRGAFELGTGYSVAMGPVRVGNLVKHMTFVQTNNGGTANPGFYIAAVETASGEVLWTYQYQYPDARTSGNPGVPSTGIPSGVAAFSMTQGTTVTHILAPSLFGEVWLINADTGANSFVNKALFASTSDFRPVGMTPALFLHPSNGISAVFVTGGYIDPIQASWHSDSVTQRLIGVPVNPAGAGSAATFTEATAPLAVDIGINRGFAQVQVAGTQIFVVTDSSDVNSSEFGLSATSTGTLSRYGFDGTPQASTPIAAGASAVDVTATGQVYVGSGRGAQKLDVAGFDPTGSGFEMTFENGITRDLWLSTK